MLPTAPSPRRRATRSVCRRGLSTRGPTCTSINGVVKCARRRGHGVDRAARSPRNDELREPAIARDGVAALPREVRWELVGGEHRGYGDVWMAGISHTGEHEWSPRQWVPIERTRSRALAFVTALSSAAMRTYGSWVEGGLAGTMDGWRGRWDDKGRASGAGITMTAPSASLRGRFREEGFRPGRGLATPGCRSSSRRARLMDMWTTTHGENDYDDPPPAFWRGRRVAGSLFGG